MDPNRPVEYRTSALIPPDAQDVTDPAQPAASGSLKGPMRVAPLVLLGLLGMAFVVLLLTSTSPATGVTGRPSADRWLDHVSGEFSGSPSSADGPCAAYPFEVRVAGRVVACTHGPDPVPDDVRAAGRIGLDELRARTPGVDGTAAAAGTAPIDCIGNGTSGLRVVAIYAHPASSPSRYAEVAPMIRSWVGEVDDVFDLSAAQTGGSRHVRWAHDAACQPNVAELTLSDTAVYGSETTGQLDAMLDELVAAGYGRTDRRYLVWVDASTFDTGICGVALNTWDESPGQTNIHNGVPQAGIGLFGRVDLDCWGRPAPEDLVEAHELMHTLGAVQPHAPYSSSVVYDDGSFDFYGHCIDEHDTMCYPDGTPKDMIDRCPESQERLFDCGHDTYFSTNPPQGSYLAKHWNPAMNAFLVRIDPVAGFIDVGPPFVGDIAWLAASGITTGCSTDLERFCPNDPVTRGQMASFLARALDLPGSATDYFTDDAGSVHEFDINRLAAAGITTGCGSTAYCPSATIRRGEMAAFLDRAFGLAPTSNDYFTDDESSIFEISINRVAAAGITTGCTATTYCPTATVTRGQMAAFLHRALID